MFGKKVPPTKPDDVKSLGDLSGYLDYLISDLEKTPEKWENESVSGYLQTISRWLKDTKTSEKSDKKIRASEVANLFYVGKVYE